MSIGIIGMGEMGKMYADRLAKGGWKKSVPPPLARPHSSQKSGQLIRTRLSLTRINVCDLPEKFDQLSAYCEGTVSRHLAREGRR